MSKKEKTSADDRFPGIQAGKARKTVQNPLIRVVTSLRRRILTGTLIMVPIVISLIPVFFLYGKLNTFAENTLKVDEEWTLAFLERWPGLAFLIVLVFMLAVLYIIGVLSTTFVVRWTMQIAEKIVNQIPVVNWCYRTTKQVVDAAASSSAKPFKKVVMIEYPRKGIYALGFVTGDAEYPGKLGKLVHIFIPTTPNPTSGFLLLFHPNEVWETGLAVDDAVRFIISGGILEMADLQLLPYQSDLVLESADAPDDGSKDETPKIPKDVSDV